MREELVQVPFNGWIPNRNGKKKVCVKQPTKQIKITLSLSWSQVRMQVWEREGKRKRERRGEEERGRKRVEGREGKERREKEEVRDFK